MKISNKGSLDLQCSYQLQIIEGKKGVPFDSYWSTEDVLMFPEYVT